MTFQLVLEHNVMAPIKKEWVLFVQYLMTKTESVAFYP
jgi:hypothetical protein